MLPVNFLGWHHVIQEWTISTNSFENVCLACGKLCKTVYTAQYIMKFTLALGLSWGVYSNSDTVSVSVTRYNMQFSSTGVYLLFKGENKDFNIYRLIVSKYYPFLLFKDN